MGLWTVLPLLLAVVALNQTSYESYFTYEQVTAKIEQLKASSHVLSTQVQVNTFSSKTASGQSITYMKITDTTSPVEEAYKGKVLVTAQHQVKGMIGASMVLYIAESLLESANLSTLQSKVFYLVPVVNPDSYSLSSPSTSLTSPYYKNQEVTNCTAGKGVNLDRNYPSGHVVVSDSCDNQYGGAAPCSAAETSVIRDLIMSTIAQLDLAVDYDSVGQLYVLPKAANSISSYELNPDYTAFINQFGSSGEFGQSGASLSTYYSADGAAAGGTFIDYVSTSTSALPFQMRLGQNPAPTSPLSLLQAHFPAFLYLATHTKTHISYFLARLMLQNIKEPACTAIQCAHSWAISTIQLPFLLKNDAVGTSAPLVFSLDLTFPANSTYNYLINNITVSSNAFASTNYSFETGVSLPYTNVTTAMPVLKLRLSMPNDRTRVLYALTVNIERFKNPNVTTYNDESLSFTYTASVNGIATSLVGLQYSATWTYGLKASYVPEQNITNPPEPTPTGTVDITGFGVGYGEPVMVGLGILILLLFVLVAVGMCGIVWMLNKPGAEAAELPLAKDKHESEVPLGPPQQV